MITKENIFKEARKRNLKVLKSDLVDKVKGNFGGWTPLHHLAYDGVKDVFDHPSVDKVKNSYGYTPLYYLALNGHLTKKNLKEKYPWYKKEIKNILKAVKEIVNTPDSIRFILED